jgi:probable F420-dependent oxidoreductase
MHPFRFAVYGGWATQSEDWLAVARRAEQLGYGALLMVDHLGRQLAPISALAAGAAVTSSIRIGSYVFANDFRHPFILAREAATLDVLSNGRLEFGLGAGWKRSDYRQLGVSYDRAGLRIDRMEEALRIIKRLWAGERVTHSGPHYRLTDARIAPLPFQRPRPPVMIGGGGPRLLRLAAREAEIVGLAPKMSPRGWPTWQEASDHETARKVALLRDAAGDRFDQLELNIFVAGCGLIDGVRPGAVSAAVKALPPRLIGGSPYLLYGTLARLREQLLRRREALGISYYGIRAQRMEEMAPLVEALAGR